MCPKPEPKNSKETVPSPSPGPAPEILEAQAKNLEARGETMAALMCRHVAEYQRKRKSTTKD